MTDMMMLLVALVAFAVLVVGWMVLPDAGAYEAASTTAPQRMPEAA
jgi:hypothetical protein